MLAVVVLMNTGRSCGTCDRGLRPSDGHVIVVCRTLPPMPPVRVELRRDPRS